MGIPKLISKFQNLNVFRSRSIYIFRVRNEIEIIVAPKPENFYSMFSPMGGGWVWIEKKTDVVWEI